MKKLVLSFLLIAFTINLAAAQNKKNPKLPKIVGARETVAPVVAKEPGAVFKFNETEHDFAAIKEGDLATHEFKFLNTGTEPIIISNVQASCGCTTPDWTREPIKAGATGFVKAQYNSQGRPGAFTKSITVTSNATQPTLVLTIKGTVNQTLPGTPEKKEEVTSPLKVNN